MGLSNETLLVAETVAARGYPVRWEEIPVSGKGIGRKPIPHDWHRAGLRQGLLTGTRRHAVHPVNAMLNYAYAVLESQVRIAVVAQGLDPTIGYLHAPNKRRVALVYDLMEPLRPQVDRHVLQTVHDHTFSPTDFLVTDRGLCRLRPQLARRVTRSMGEAGGARQVVGGVVSLLAFG